MDIIPQKFHDHFSTMLLLIKQASFSAFSSVQHTDIQIQASPPQHGYFFTGCGGVKAYAHSFWYFYSQEVDSNSPPFDYGLALVTY